MAEQKPAAIHFSDGTKIICGTKTGTIASGEQKVTCGRCIALLRTREPEKPQAKQNVQNTEDPNAIHFSDGTKVVCGAKDVIAGTDEQRVTCKQCLTFLAKKAQSEGNPLIKVRVKNMDLNDGVDWTFSHEYDKATNQMKGYHLVNNAVHMLPKSVVKHLESIAYPYKRYVPGQESGHAMQVAGKYRRFVITRIEAA